MTTPLTPTPTIDVPLTLEASDVLGEDEFAEVLGSHANRTQAAYPDRQVFTTSGTWNKPANASVVSFLVTGGGGGGGSVSSGGSRGGGGGGEAGKTKHRILPAAQVPDSLSVDVGSHGLGGAGGSGGNPGGASSVYDTSPLRFRIEAAGGIGGGGSTTTPEGAGGSSSPHNNYVASGGDGAPVGGGTGTDGEDGYNCVGGNGGLTQAAGKGGRGYGAGGGGGANQGASAGGGGGGGGGVGGETVAAQDGTTGAGTGDGPGGNAVPGIVVITTWRGP